MKDQKRYTAYPEDTAIMERNLEMVQPGAWSKLRGLTPEETQAILQEAQLRAWADEVKRKALK